jgi:hypothetical protein
VSRKPRLGGFEGAHALLELLAEALVRGGGRGVAAAHVAFESWQRRLETGFSLYSFKG